MLDTLLDEERPLDLALLPLERLLAEGGVTLLRLFSDRCLSLRRSSGWFFAAVGLGERCGFSAAPPFFLASFSLPPIQ